MNDTKKGADQCKMLTRSRQPLTAGLKLAHPWCPSQHALHLYTTHPLAGLFSRPFPYLSSREERVHAEWQRALYMRNAHADAVDKK